MYDGLWDKWSHSLIPTPLNPLSPLFAILDPYYMERAHKDDMPYPVSGPMFTEGTPWGAVLNPTIGALIKPEREEHSFRFDHGIDVVSLLHTANESIRERARDFTRTHYVSIKGGQVSAVDFNVWNAPTPDTSAMSIRTTSGGLVGISTGTYGIYGDGSKGYAIGSAGGAALGAYDIKSLGRAPGGGYGQNVSAGFNSFENQMDLQKRILAYAEPTSTAEIIRQSLFGDNNYHVRHGEIVVNEEGQLGIYQNRPITKPKGTFFTAKENLAIDAVTSRYTQDDKMAVLDIINDNVPVTILRGLNEELIKESKQHVDSPYAVDEDLGFTTAEKLSSFNPSKSMELINDADTVSDLINQGSGSDFVRNATTSMRLIGGIYGYMGSELVGLGVHEDKVLADSSDMYAFNRRFWDLNLGGAGGAVSEIGRRFIPNFQRLTKVNPLMNEMPDWLPERFRTGNPYCVSDDTLVEQNELEFNTAQTVKVNNSLLAHNGKLDTVQNLAVRQVRDDETLFDFQIMSLSPVHSVYSEEHPILCCTNHIALRHNKVPRFLGLQKRLNDIIKCLKSGIVSKKDISKFVGIPKGDLCFYLNKLYKSDIILDYRYSTTVQLAQTDVKLTDEAMIHNRVQWIKAKDIKVGDYVAYPVPEYNPRSIILDLAHITEYPATERYLYYSGQLKNIEVAIIYEYLQEHGIAEYKYRELKEFLQIKKWRYESYHTARALLKKQIAPLRMNRYITLTPELCYALGLYLAEGSTTGKCINYSLHIKEKSLFDRAVKGIIDSGICIEKSCFKQGHTKNSGEGYVYSKVLSQVFTYLVGKCAHNKTLCNELWYLGEEETARFIEGYVDGDGYHNFNKTNVHPRLSISSCNLKLLLQIRKLLIRFKVVGALSVRKPQLTVINNHSIQTGLNYQLVVSGTAACTLAFKLYNRKITYRASRSIQQRIIMTDQYIYMRVKSIRTMDKTQYPKVYGFTMTQFNTFCTAGVATHNTKIPHGESRLPSRGYETVNELHPDQFSTEKDRTGAFDRFKILADIAPGTPEYKLWREIAKKTVTDPELLQEMEEIKQRAREQGKKHDFYNYQIVGKELDYKPVVISEVLGYGKFRSGNVIYKMAGITVQGNAEENAQEVLSRYLRPGQKVIVGIDTNQAYAQNKDAQKTINAAVYVNGESLNQLMLESGDAKKRKGDKSAAATIGQLTPMQEMIGLASEVIGHMDIPIISDQWLRIRSPYESYLAEEVYGTPYQSWAHPINTFLYPAIERAIHERSIGDLLLFDAFSWVREHERTPDIDTTIFGVPLKVKSQQISRGPKQLLYMTSILGNRATLVGHAVGNMLDAGNSKLAMPISTGLNLAVTATHMLTGGTSMFDMVTLGAYVGKEAARINEVTGKGAIAKYAAVGAAASMGFRAFHTAVYGDWTPPRQHRKHEMQDYWDRLNYIKWQGLYEEAARRAKEEENVDVERFLENAEERDQKRKATLDKLQRIKDSLNQAYGGKTNELKNYLLKLVNSRIAELQPSEQMVEGGKYTQSAIIYKRAAEATMYGLKKGASWSSIISALPTNDREYFMEFVSETDKTKRDKILAIASPSLKKALQVSWGIKPDKQEDNEDFFEDHYLPDSDWMGWRPDVDLNDIAVKTVANEAMNLSDFGFYESALREPEVQKATPLPYNKENDDISLSSELRSLLKGKGLHDVEVSVTAKNTMGPTDIVANIAVWAGLKEQQKKVEDSMRAWI